MSKLILLWLTLALGILFLALPYSEQTKDYFPLFSSQQLTLQMHVWFILNKLVFVVFAYIIVNEATKYRLALWVFFGCQVLKLADYLLTYNEIWGTIGNIPVSSTSVGMMAFSLSIVYEWLWNKE